EILRLGTEGFAGHETNVHVILARLAVLAYYRPTNRRAQGAGRLLSGDPEIGGAIPVYREEKLRLYVLVVVVNVHRAGRLPRDSGDLIHELVQRRGVGPSHRG